MFIADVPYAKKLRDHMVRSVQFALEEDIGSGDITAELIPADKMAKAEVITREAGILCGREWFDEVFRQVDESVLLEWHNEDGDHLEPNDKLVTIKGPARSILTAERNGLNYLQTLSGTATVAHQYAMAVKDKRVAILDTRKTLPTLRLAQKYAVKVGGCENHRLGLFDQFLIKENHIASCGGIKEAIYAARRLYPERPIEIEVETLEQLKKAIYAEADIVMLDNFDTDSTSQAIEIAHHKVKIESSGNIDLDWLKKLQSNASADFISVGAITKHITALDLSLRISTF